MLLKIPFKGFTLRSSRDYVPQIDKLVQFNTKNYLLQKKVKPVHPEILEKQRIVI